MQRRSWNIKYSVGIRKVYQYAEPNLTLIGWLGFIGFPLYYFVWDYMFPQTYENLTLRVLCSALFLGLVCRNKLNIQLQKYMHWFYLIAVTVGLPFFFSYMLLMNGWSQIWVMSFMSAIFIHILLVHITWIMFTQTLVGVLLATGLAWVSNGYSLDISVDYAQLPVFFFTYLFGNLCFNRYQEDYDSKVALAKSFGAGIAHEMRNPLSSLSSSLDVIQTIIPNHKLKRADHYSLTYKDIEQLQEVSDDALRVIQSGNETIDLLLASIDENRISRTTFKTHSAREVLDNAISSYSFKSLVDKESVSFATSEDFRFFGSGNLLKFVVFNLLKNAFYHASIDDFKISLSLRTTDSHNLIVFRDTGSGITPSALKNIFKDFYTTGNSGRYGLGLPFCKRVMHSFGGDIQCDSAQGEWTEFTLSFPLENSNQIRNIKKELFSSKSILLVSEQTDLNAAMHVMANQLGFQLKQLSIDASLGLHEHISQYDIVLLDVDNALTKPNTLEPFESLWGFSEATIVYLFKDRPVQRHHKAAYLPLWIERDSCLFDTYNILDNLVFDTDGMRSAVNFTTAEKVGTRKVLLVDDNESLRKFTAILLQKEGIDVLQTENGQQALSVLAREEVDLILMDIEMPIMDGIETTKRIRQSNQAFAGVPIIAHTGDNSRDMLDKISSSFMSGYLVKPASKKQLLDVISDWI